MKLSISVLLVVLAISLTSCGPCGTCETGKISKIQESIGNNLEVNRFIDKELGVACYQDVDDSRNISCVLVPSLKSY